MRLVVKARSHKYVKKWRGANGEWQYKYATPKSQGTDVRISTKPTSGSMSATGGGVLHKYNVMQIAAFTGVDPRHVSAWATEFDVPIGEYTWKSFKQWVGPDWETKLKRAVIEHRPLKLEPTETIDEEDVAMANSERNIQVIAMGTGISERFVLKWARNTDTPIEKYSTVQFRQHYGEMTDIEFYTGMLEALKFDLTPEEAFKRIGERKKAETDDYSDEERRAESERLHKYSCRAEYQDVEPSQRVYALKDNNVAFTVPLADEDAGINGTYVVTLMNGMEIKGIWKPQNEEYCMLHGGEPLRKYIPTGTSHMREEAAYRLDDAIGFGLVPPTVQRTLKEGSGSIQEFLADGMDPSYKDVQHSEELEVAAVMDFIMFNTDRHNLNWMTTDKGHVALIDNGLAFPTNDSIDFLSRFFDAFGGDTHYIDSEIMLKLERTDWLTVQNDLLEVGLEPEAIKGMMARVNWLMEQGTLPSNSDIDNTAWKVAQ